MSKKEYMEFRYYDMPQEDPLLVFEGEGWKRNYGNDAPYLHFHNILEIGICNYGNGRMVYEDGTKEFSDGMISLIPKNVPHNTISEGDSISYWEFLFVDETPYVQEIYKEEPMRVATMIECMNARPLLLVGEEASEMEWLVRGIIREYREKKAHYKITAKYMLMSLLMLFYRENRSCRKHAIDEMHLHNTRIQAAVSYIEKQFMEPIQVRQLAELSHISETHFRRLFVENMHMTPIEYISLVRVRKACELLKSSNYDMESIAVRTGFMTSSTFNRNFKRMLGVSPYQWKKDHQFHEKNSTGINVSAYKGWE